MPRILHMRPPSYTCLVPLPVAAISFLNPAPLLYSFEHEPSATALRGRYTLHYTSPAHCARELLAGEADLGLIPVASLTPELAIVPGCTIASLRHVRSILLLVRNPDGLSVAAALKGVRTVAADAASRSSQAYVRVLFERFYGARPQLLEQPADALTMLAGADAALLIGDPALLAREHRSAIDADADIPLLWLDVAELWREHTGLPWVAAVWAVRPDALAAGPLTAQQLTADLTSSRDAGLAHIDQLVAEWTPRLNLRPETIRTYLTQNIHYTLDQDCLRAIQHFRTLAAQIGALPSLRSLNLLR